MFLYEACMNISDDNYEVIKHTIQDMFDELDEKENLSDKNEETKDSLEELLDTLESRDYEWFKTSVSFHQSNYGGMKRKKLYDPSEEYEAPKEHYVTLKQFVDLLGYKIWFDFLCRDLENKLSEQELETIRNKYEELDNLVMTINNQIY